ncbi:arabinofuranosidase catalytic domain-containing protein [Tenacibaculum sp.]|nr:arabinofuranosidase catalytic domain-containing protein [Tenacibaculum sp.]
MCNSQIAKFNHFPTFKPLHILDDKLENISFALSMRVLESDYNGPLIRLRRASDNAEQDFSWSDNDIVDITAINNWRGTSNVFIHTWYDQSGLGRDAIQTINNQQPRFFPDINNPYFQGDGSNDHLTIDTPNGIQDVTNNGDQGTVLGVMRATRKSQHTFGVLVNRNRWSTHINWNNNRVYFDPGFCCNPTRSFFNSSGINVWIHYTFIKTNTNVIARSSGIQRFNGIHVNAKCTRTEDFAIGWATGNKPASHSTTSFTELIMYKTDIVNTQYQEIEENSILFWAL